MRLRNDQGTPVDPVPFAVTTAAAFLVLYSFGPGYLLGLGLSLADALLVVTGLYATVAVVAYHRLVLRARPNLRAEIPGPMRLKRLYYAVLVGIALGILLLLPYSL